MEAFLVSTGVVALAEMGDKTQLLAFVLAARFRKPVPIIAGILLATLANHTIAGALGAWITSQLSPGALRIALGVSIDPVATAPGSDTWPVATAPGSVTSTIS